MTNMGTIAISAHANMDIKSAAAMNLFAILNQHGRRRRNGL
ncbi:MAG: hypothetical protein ACLPHI_19895 [Terriglobales bacterium]|jgi:hypothetical protein